VFDVATPDGLSLVLGAVTAMIAALLAYVAAASRAIRVDPVVAMQADQ
jgi:ABC-type lipoprotein release transport system permease subunit